MSPHWKSEQRRHERQQIHLPVRMARQTLDPKSESFFISALTDLSPSGAFVSTTAQYKEGAMVSLEFEVPLEDRENPLHGLTRRSIHAIGQVAWMTRNQNSHDSLMGVGVRFVLLTDEERAVIQHFLDYVGRGIKKRSKFLHRLLAEEETRF